MARTLRTLALCGAALLTVSGVASAKPQPTGPTVTVAQGTLMGRDDGAAKAFLGIPYAAAPVGKNRWRAPQSAHAWKGTRNATQYGPSCVQDVLPGGRPPWTAEYMVQGKVNEDCLSLNIWSPAGTIKNAPVIVWIHGGGFNEGSASVPIYRGAALAGRGVVVVTINYRLGLYGFLAHPDLTKEAGAGAPSNFGLQDQIAALQWVKTNIAAFGGDPAKVTIAGQSAGSMAVHSLVASPMAKGLFAGAIAQSGLPNIMPMPSLADAEARGVAYAKDRGAQSLSDLRKMKPAQLALRSGTEMGGQFRFGPMVDGRLLPLAPAEMVAKGDYNDVPMIVGQTADEGSAFPGYGDGSADGYAAFMQRSFGASAAVFQALYPATTDAERSEAVKSASRDRGLAMIGEWTRAKFGGSQSPVWGYFFNYAEPGEGTEQFAAFHSSEIPYIFGTLDMAPERNFTLADRGLSLAMSSYWVNFAKYGNPNGDGLTPWTPMNASGSILEFRGSGNAERALLTPDKAAAYQEFVANGGMLSMF